MTSNKRRERVQGPSGGKATNPSQAKTLNKKNYSQRDTPRSDALFRWSPDEIRVHEPCLADIPGSDWQLSLDEWKDMLRVLQGFTTDTWGQILTMQASGSPRNHYQDLNSLHPELAGMVEGVAEVAFRIRLDGTRRVWGFCHGVTFYPMLYDRDHKGYATKMKHT
jgi:hypothetical protein